MQGRKWRIGFFLVLLILIGMLLSIWIYPPLIENHPLSSTLQKNLCSTVSVPAYIPTWAGAKLKFSGQGLEFADFTRTISYASPDLLQIEDSSGTNVVNIVELTPLEMRIVWTGEEFYEKRSLLGPWVRKEHQLLPGRPESLIPLKAPLTLGESWSDSRFKREIYQVKREVTVPLGTFYDVVVVKSTPLEGEGIQYEYYAKNIGLIKRKSQYQTLTVISELAELEVVSPHVHSGN